MDYNQFRNLLPETSRSEFDTIWNETAGSSKKLTVCLAGAFSTGKTSLLNYLLGGNILPVALEESTTLPTFIEYGDQASFNLLVRDREEKIAAEDLSAIIANPPEGSRLLEASLPLGWLRGLSIIDLPGAGSMFMARRQYAGEIMRLADAVIYLLPSRGPSKSDLEDLRSLHLMGKQVFIGASHWDEVERAAQLGEQKPDLRQWAREIEYNCGIKTSIEPVSNKGLGADAVLAFLTTAVRNLQSLRLARFKCEATPVLENIIAADTQAIESLGANTEAEAIEAHGKLLSAKSDLLKMREEAIKEQRKETESILGQWDEYEKSCQRRLQEELEEQAAKAETLEELDSFMQESKTLLKRNLDESAVFASRLSEKYGRFNLEQREFAGTGIALAKPPTVAVTDFLDAGRYSLLQSRLEELAAKMRETSEDLDDTASRKAAIEELMLDIQRLESSHAQLSSLPVPCYEEKIEGSNSGSIIGRAIGEVADIALLFVNPAFAAGKVGTITGKAGKAIGMSAKAARAAAKAAKTASRAALIANRSLKSVNSLEGLAEKAQKLEVLTLGYWCEKLGSAFDSKPIAQMRIDREALETQKQELQQLNNEITKRKLQVFDLENELKTPGADKGKINAEIAAIESKMAEMKATAERQKLEAEQDAQAEFERRFTYEKNKFQKEILRFCNIQLMAMRDLLASMLKNWWENCLQEQLAEQQNRVSSLLAEMQDLPEKRKARELEIRAELERIDKAAKLLPA